VATAAVEGFGVDPIQLSHAPGKGSLRGLDEEVVVVIHEAVGVAAEAVASNHLSQDPEGRKGDHHHPGRRVTPRFPGW